MNISILENFIKEAKITGRPITWNNLNRYKNRLKGGM